jgi:cytidylate kinase
MIKRQLAERLGASYLDTGAMYRAVTLAAMQADVEMDNEEKLLGVLQNSEMRFAADEGKMVVRLNGVDVTEQIRAPEVTTKAQHIASAAKVRDKLVDMQRQFAAGEAKMVTEGRDQGTVAFPDADVKFYLVAEAAERARRRQAELSANRVSGSFEKIQKAIEERDKSDEDRTVGPLKPADDAIIIDTTDLTIEEVVEKFLRCIEEKCPKRNQK